MDETARRLTLAAEQHQLLAEIAQKNGAQEAGDNQDAVASILQAQNDAVVGTLSKAGGFPELAKPHLVLASPAGIATTTAGDTHIASERHTACTTGKSLSLAAGASFFANVRQTFRLFVQKAGMKMVAAAGDIDVQALSDSINLLAKLDITQSANRIIISAQEEIVLNGGGSYAKLGAGSIELGTSGTFTAHAATHSFPSSKSMSVSVTAAAARYGSSFATEQTLVELTESNSWVEFELVDQNGPIAGERYVLTDPTGKEHAGTVDGQGMARIDQIPPGRCKVEFPELGYSMEVSAV
jgi:type VI secretion system secreted protein VgrG